MSRSQLQENLISVGTTIIIIVAALQFFYIVNPICRATSQDRFWKDIC